MKTVSYNSLTDALRECFAASGISFKKLSEETGLKRQSLMKFMRGKQSLRLDLADKLAAFFGLIVVKKGKG
jgi:transcriptional regulator with XRE-family HTH domain